MDKKYCLNYLRELLKSLSCDSSTQQQMVPKELMWNISSDIANEWDYETSSFLLKIYWKATLYQSILKKVLKQSVIISKKFH